MNDGWTPDEQRLIAIGQRELAALIAMLRGASPESLARSMPRDSRDAGIGVTESTLRALESRGVRLLLDAMAAGRKPPGLPPAFWPDANERQRLLAPGSGASARGEQARELRAWLRRSRELAIA